MIGVKLGPCFFICHDQCSGQDSLVDILTENEAYDKGCLVSWEVVKAKDDNYHILD